MRQLPIIPDSEVPLTLRQHEQYVHDNHPRKEGETDEEFQKRLNERLDRLRVDFERKSKRGTLYLMDAPTHLERQRRSKGSQMKRATPKSACVFSKLHRFIVAMQNDLMQREQRKKVNAV